MQAHDFHQHLVGIGRAIECASAGTMIGLGFGFQKCGPVHFAFSIKLADFCLVFIAHARGHGACGNKHGGQVAEVECTHDKSRHDLVTHAEIDCRIEHLVRQGDGRGKGDDIAGEQRQLHACFTLRDTITHGGNAACHLRRATCIAGGLLDDIRVFFKGLMGRQHVIEGCHNGKVGA